MPSCSNNLRRARPLLGTVVEIETVGLAEGDAHAAIDTAFAVVEEVQRRMSFHDPASTLSRLNRLAGIETVRVDPWTFEVLRFAREMYCVSGGLFAPTIAPLLVARGFLPPHSPTGPESRVARFDQVQLSADCLVRFHDPAVCLDLGGIAKGFAVDQAVTALRDAGASCGLVNAGGDLRAFGDQSFDVSIRHPDAPGTALTVVSLNDASLATSAHYFAERVVPGAKFAPIFHPHTGTPARAVRGATVRAPTAMSADALTKVVMLGGKAALPVLEHFHANAIFVAHDGEVLCSPGWHAALELSS